MNTKPLIICLLTSVLTLPLVHGQTSVTSSYTQNFDSIGSALPEGWAVWTSSTASTNGTSFTWNTAEIANNATVNDTNYFRNLPGASQTWSAALSTGTDRAIGWRAGNAASRDGSITFTLSNTTGWTFSTMQFDVFTPNSTGTAGTFNLEYQIGSSGTFTQLAGKSYTNTPITTGDTLTKTIIQLTASDLSVLNNQSQQVTLRINNTATSGTTWNTLAIDNFSYTAVPSIPEPSTTALLSGLGLLGASALLRRRRA